VQICYPKGNKADINRDTIWAAAHSPWLEARQQCVDRRDMVCPECQDRA
jgi:hypothetical protein